MAFMGCRKTSMQSSAVRRGLYHRSIHRASVLARSKDRYPLHIISSISQVVIHVSAGMRTTDHYRNADKYI